MNAQQQRQPQNDQRAQNDERREGALPPEPPPGSPDERARLSGRWGMLPKKLHQDATNAEQVPPPSRWRALIERYRERLATAGER